MKSKSILKAGTLIVTLFSIAGFSHAKPDFHESEKKRHHSQTERHISKKHLKDIRKIKGEKHSRYKGHKNHDKQHWHNNTRNIKGSIKGNVKNHGSHRGDKYATRNQNYRHGKDKYRYNDKRHEHKRYDHKKGRYYNGWSHGGDKWKRHYRLKHKHHYGHQNQRYNDRRHHLNVYWGDHRRHGYRHKRYQGHHYYFNQAGFFFPGFGSIKHGHDHGIHCPDWHLEDFVAGAILGSVLRH